MRALNSLAGGIAALKRIATALEEIATILKSGVVNVETAEKSAKNKSETQS